MNCFECAKANDTVPAVGVCQHCGVGLCLDHLSRRASTGSAARSSAARTRSRAVEAAARRPGRHRRRRPPPHRVGVS